MGIKPSDLGALPPDWKAVKFGAITKVRQGLQIAISERLTKPTLTSQEYITIQSINRQNQGREYVESPSTRVTCKSDDVLMTRTGNTGIVVTGVEGAFHNNFFLIDFDRKELDSIFLVNYLRSPRVQHVLLTKAGASTIPDLNHKDFYSIDFPLAPLPEQKKIAKILSTWDKTITTTEQLLHNSQQQKKALMQQLLTGKKRLLDKNGVRFSGEWNALNLGEILSKVSNGVTYDAKNVEGLPVTRIETISTGKVNFDKVGFAPDEENTRRFKLHQGDILYSHINSLEHIGRVAYFNDARPLYHGMNLLLLRTGEKHDSLYIYYLLGSELGKKYAKSYAKSAVNQASISTTDVKAFRFLIPNLPEQQKIAAVLSAADQEISALQQKLDALKQEKKALMQQLLTGKRRVTIEKKELLK